MCLVPALSLGQDDPKSSRPKEGDLLVKADDSSMKPLTPVDIPFGAAHTFAWSMDPADNTVRNGSRLNQVLLLRLNAEKFSSETKQHAAEGVIAYTAICTHSGCEIDEWAADEQILICTCHQSSFDPKNGATVVNGPAPRPLPALPLKLVDGRLVVASSFTTRVGFELA